MTSEKTPPAVKKQTLLALLETSWAYLYVDGRLEGVDLPEWLRQPSVTLHIGYDMPVPIVDLVVDEQGVSCTLSFRRTPHHCKLPWSSVFAISDGEEKLVVFPEDVPAELREQLEKMKSTPHEIPTAAPTRSAPPPRPRAQTAAARVTDDFDETAEGSEAATPAPVDDVPRFKSGRPRPSFLKSV